MNSQIASIDGIVKTLYKLSHLDLVLCGVTISNGIVQVRYYNIELWSGYGQL